MHDDPVDKCAPRPEIPSSADVVVCGGGPGGSTVAAILARKGHRVVLFERERFPRFHVGESLLPWNLPLFEQIGVLEKIREAGVQVKYGARFYHQGTTFTRPVRFENGIDQDHPSAFQVKRAEFDQLLLNHAREGGATVFEGTRVEKVLFEGTPRRVTGVGVKTVGDETPREVRAKVVVDATGRDALFARFLGGRTRDPLLDRSAAFAHFDRFRRAEGPTGGDIVVITTPDGWWWLIPFSDGTVSVGVVMPSRRFKERPGTVAELFESSLTATPEVKDLLEGSRRLTEIHSIADYSYSTPEIAGDGFCLVGDAACFLDPVFSTGVLMAMTAGELASETIDRCLRTKGRVDQADFARFERVYRRGVSRFRRFVHGFYEPDFLEAFYSPAPNKWMERAVTTLLGGGVWEPGFKARWWTFWFYAAVLLIRVRQRVQGKGAFERATGVLG